MVRTFTSLMWLCVAVAFSFDAVAQPCDVRDDLLSQTEIVMVEDMPCHDGMDMMMDDDSGDMPMQSDTCCCAALLTNVTVLDGAILARPLPIALAWADPLPENADSISFEYEPPPPRA